MSITIKQEKIGNFYICMEVEFPRGYDVYHVSLCEDGRLLLENYYGEGQKETAKRCYYRYTARARKEARA